MRGVDGQDDFAAMAEVVTRRFARAATPAAEEYDASFAATPNLVVVDGGKGQLSAVLAAMQAFDLPRVAVISLAKREEEVFLPGKPRPVVLDRHSPALQLLQRDPGRGAPVRARLPPAAPRRAPRASRSSTRSKASAPRAGAR